MFQTVYFTNINVYYKSTRNNINVDFFYNVYRMLSPDKVKHVDTGRDGRLPGQALGLCTIDAQQSFRLTGTMIGVE
jgi:hypothetical protein